MIRVMVSFRNERSFFQKGGPFCLWEVGYLKPKALSIYAYILCYVNAYSNQL